MSDYPKEEHNWRGSSLSFEHGGEVIKVQAQLSEYGLVLNVSKETDNEFGDFLCGSWTEYPQMGVEVKNIDLSTEKHLEKFFNMKNRGKQHDFVASTIVNESVLQEEGDE
tara:strand:+ start:211 stop:540 length:330 start_codon:yes stop_codon:yes gene_type:complete